MPVEAFVQTGERTVISYLMADAVSYVFVVGSLLLMHVNRTPPHTGEARMLEELRDGWRYVRASVPIRTALIVLAIVSMPMGAMRWRRNSGSTRCSKLRNDASNTLSGI